MMAMAMVVVVEVCGGEGRGGGAARPLVFGGVFVLVNRRGIGLGERVWKTIMYG